MKTRVLVQMLVLKNCGSFEIQCFPVVVLHYCDAQRQNLDQIFTVLTGILKMENIPIGLVCFNTEQLILTLLMSLTKPQ